MTHYATKQDAINFLDSLVNAGELTKHSGGYSPAGTYYLAHGEYSQPDYKPVRYKDGWGIKKIHYYYVGTLHAQHDGRVSDDYFSPFSNI